MGHVQPELTQGGVDQRPRRVGDHQDHIPVFDPKAFHHRSLFGVTEKLDDIGVQLSIGHPHPRHTFGPETGHNFLGIFILKNVFAQLPGRALDVKPLDISAAMQDLLEDRITGIGKNVGGLYES